MEAKPTQFQEDQAKRKTRALSRADFERLLSDARADALKQMEKLAGKKWEDGIENPPPPLHLRIERAEWLKEFKDAIRRAKKLHDDSPPKESDDDNEQEKNELQL